MPPFCWMPERLTNISAPSAIGHTRLSERRNGSDLADVKRAPKTSYRCLVDHLPPDMSEAIFRAFIGVAADVPITWFPGHEYVWCIVNVSETEALAMERYLDGLELDDQHTLRCEAIGVGGSTYASSWSHQMSVASSE